MKTKDKKQKAIKALRLLFIGELFVVLGLLSELEVIYDPLALISLVSLVGIIIVLVGIIKLARVNKFFFMSFICVCFAFLVGIVEAVLDIAGASHNSLMVYESITDILAKLASMLFTFGIIRGCSKAATGKANSRFANVMSIVNLVGKVISIVFIILESIYRDDNELAANIFLLISLLAAAGAEIFFVIYLYRAYSKARKTLAVNQ